MTYVETTAQRAGVSICDRVSDLVSCMIQIEEQQDAEQAAQEHVGIDALPPIVNSSLNLVGDRPT
jgi:hypothetical protein